MIDDFVSAATAFLDTHCTRRDDAAFVWGEGSDRISILPERSLAEDLADKAAAADWLRTRFDAGYERLQGDEARAFATLERDYEQPDLTSFGISLGMVAPTLEMFGSTHAKETHLTALLRGDELACQLFSEPSAGSDVASLTTRAERDGAEWVVNGQKVWTSCAHLADLGLLLARTNTSVEKHKGLTMFLIDMRQPGVEVRPLRQMNGAASFNEVFFTDARIPDSMRLGEVDQGWSVALATLLNERASVSEGNQGSPIDRLIELARQMGTARDPLARQRLADAYIHSRVASLTTDRAMAKVLAGQLPGPELSLSKVALTNNLTRLSAVAASVLGPKLIADAGEWGTYAWGEFVLTAPGLRLGGGTDEIQKNIIGERVLGLPREPK